MARITVEDCLKEVPSRFMLVHLAAQRARDLIKGSPSFVKSDNKAVVTALREIAAGKVVAQQPGNKKKLAE
ncbi:MAG: DNA-directed RNA polymerase subunit omega [Candidatus Methylomirabilis sp.]|nr:DNA-directed RNA polymerase subunit omega [Deltaproteobacteria bacterium]